MKRKQLDWTRIVEEHKSSGQSVELFCQEKEIHPNTFYRHRKLLHQKNQTDTVLVNIKYTPEVQEHKPIRVLLHEFIIEIPSGADSLTVESMLRMIKELVCS